MTAQMTPSERQLCTLARIVSEERADLPAHGLPFSLLSELKDLIHCDAISFEGFDSRPTAGASGTPPASSDRTP